MLCVFPENILHAVFLYAELILLFKWLTELGVQYTWRIECWPGVYRINGISLSKVSLVRDLLIFSRAKSEAGKEEKAT